MADLRKNIDIPVGFVAFYNPNSKKVTGITEFKTQSKGFSSLLIIVKPTEQELMNEITAQGLSYVAPTPKTPPTTPQPPSTPTPPPQA